MWISIHSRPDCFSTLSSLRVCRLAVWYKCNTGVTQPVRCMVVDFNKLKPTKHLLININVDNQCSNLSLDPGTFTFTSIRSSQRVLNVEITLFESLFNVHDIHVVHIFFYDSEHACFITNSTPRIRLLRFLDPVSQPFLVTCMVDIKPVSDLHSKCWVFLRHESRNKGMKHSWKKNSRMSCDSNPVCRDKNPGLPGQCSNHWAKESTPWRSCQRVNIYLQAMRNLPRQIIEGRSARP